MKKAYENRAGHFYNLIFISLLLITYFIIAQHGFDSIIQVGIYLFAVGAGISSVLSSGQTVADDRQSIVVKSMQFTIEVLDNEVYQRLVVIVSSILAIICIGILLSFVFVNARKRVLQNTKLMSKHGSLQNVYSFINETMQLPNLQLMIRTSPGGDIESFATSRQRYLIISNAVLKSATLAVKMVQDEVSNMKFLLFHEQHHLIGFDTFFKAVFLASRSIMILLILILFFRISLAWISLPFVLGMLGIFSTIRFESVIYTFGGGIAFLLRIIITFLFYQRFVIEFQHFKEYDADLYAYTRTNRKIPPILIQESRATDKDIYHPTRLKRLSALNSGRYSIDLVPIAFLPISLLGLTQNDYFVRSSSAWIVPISICALVLVDRLSYRRLIVTRRNGGLLLFYAIITIVELVSLLKAFPLLFEVFGRHVTLSSALLTPMLGLYSSSLIPIYIVWWLSAQQPGMIWKIQNSPVPSTDTSPKKYDIDIISLIVRGWTAVTISVSIVFILPFIIAATTSLLNDITIVNVASAIIVLIYFAIFTRYSIITLLGWHNTLTSALIFVGCAWILFFVIYALTMLLHFGIYNDATLANLSPQDIEQFWPLLGQTSLRDITNMFPTIQGNSLLQLLVFINGIGSAALLIQQKGQ